MIPREPPQDGNEWYQRSWFLLSRELHEHDCGKRMYLPTPRGCPGVERENDWPDRIVFWTCLIAFALSVLWGIV